MPDFNLFGVVPVTSGSGSGLFIIAALFALRHWNNQMINIVCCAYSILFISVNLIFFAPSFVFFMVPFALALTYAGFPIRQKIMEASKAGAGDNES
jgi:4-amino-4-deoxy-L-arabinose transferase-like glycosyltransferase